MSYFCIIIEEDDIDMIEIKILIIGLLHKKSLTLQKV